MNSQTSESVNFSSESFEGAEWLNAVEAAVYLRLFKRNVTPSVESLRNLVCQKRIPSYKPWGRLMFKRTELQNFIETSRKGMSHVNNVILRSRRG